MCNTSGRVSGTETKILELWPTAKSVCCMTGCSVICTWLKLNSTLNWLHTPKCHYRNGGSNSRGCKWHWNKHVSVNLCCNVWNTQMGRCLRASSGTQLELHCCTHTWHAPLPVSFTKHTRLIWRSIYIAQFSISALSMLLLPYTCIAACFQPHHHPSIHLQALARSYFIITPQYLMETQTAGSDESGHPNTMFCCYISISNMSCLTEPNKKLNNYQFQSNLWHLC